MTDQDQDFKTPCYVLASTGSRYSLSYEDDWCYGESRYLGAPADDDAAREMVKADIRRAPGERNGLPFYFVSDHGNVHRRRTISLRRQTKMGGE